MSKADRFGEAFGRYRRAAGARIAELSFALAFTQARDTARQAGRRARQGVDEGPSAPVRPLCAAAPLFCARPPRSHGAG